jgi:hypothetical protein
MGEEKSFGSLFSTKRKSAKFGFGKKGSLLQRLPKYTSLE